MLSTLAGRSQAGGDAETALRYGLGVALVLLATGATAFIYRIQPSHPVLYAYYGAIVAATWFAGIGPGCLAAVVAVLTAEYFWVPPFHSFGIEPSAFPDFLVFVTVAALGVAVTAGIRYRPAQKMAVPDNLASAPASPPATPAKSLAAPARGAALPADLKQLEAEAITIFREAAAEFRNSVLLYSIGKDSSVLLHLARKAFHPGKPPFPLLHIDTTWKFREMIAFRDAIAAKLGVELIVHTNQEGLERGINPIASGSALHTQVMKTEALRQALDKFGFDAAIGGARRDEEKSRAKERIFSFRAAGHAWEPRHQRPELWHLYNTKIRSGESMRVFPLSNWTELDVWRYIEAEGIEVVPLYFALERPVVRRGNTLIVVDDERLPLEPGEKPESHRVRFRTLGCYPLTGAIESHATSVADIVAELRASRLSERQGRLIDGDGDASMERKKREGYF
jgi:sulfate adenylyltransferase subunit 2